MTPREQPRPATSGFACTVPAEAFGGAPAASSTLAPAPPSDTSAPRLRGEDLSVRLTPGAAGSARYQVERVLGMGATGCVYAVFDRNLRRQIAVKVLEPQLAADPVELAGFIEEARTTASLTHPNVLPVHEIEVGDDGRPYFAMGRIEGSSLGALIERAESGERDTRIATTNALVSMAIAVCNAVAFAHHHGIIHQDIKPDNIMLGDFGEVLLLDWGSAGRCDEHGAVGARIYGTPLYMSPEQARRERSDRRSDVYCIGSTLFHALTRRVPTWHDDPERFWELKRSGAIDAPTPQERRALPPELLAIALKAMAAEPDARYASADAMRRDLEAYQAGLAVSAHRGSWWRRFRRWHRRNARLFWVSVAAAVAVAASATAIGLEKRKERSEWRLLHAQDFSAGIEAAAEHWVGCVRSDGNRMPWSDVPLTDSEVFSLSDGALLLRSDAPLERFQGRKPIVDVRYARTLRGSVRVEWTCLAPNVARNLNCFIGGTNRESGFTFHVGGFDDPSSVVLTKGPDYLNLRHHTLRAPLVPGRRYPFAMERVDRSIRLWVDGELAIDHVDIEDFGASSGQSFGFDSYINNTLAIDDVRVYHRPLAQKISPIAVGDRPFQRGSWAEAAAEYDEILAAYPGTALARVAEFKRALCAGRAGDADASARLLAFERGHAGDQLCALARFERIKLARAAGDEREVTALRDAMAEFRGQPILRQVLLDIGQESTTGLARVLPRAWGDLEYPEDALATAQARHLRLLAYADAFGTGIEKNPFFKVSAQVNQHFGDYAFLLGQPGFPPIDRAFALSRLCRFDEALAHPGISVPTRYATLLAQARYQEITLAPQLQPSHRAHALWHLGRIADIEALDRRLWLEFRIRRKEGAEVVALIEREDPLRAVPELDQLRLRALESLEQNERILAEYPTPAQRGRALLKLGRFAEVLSTIPHDTAASQMATLGLWAARDPAREEALAGLQRMRSHASQDHVAFGTHVMPAVLRQLDGQPVDLRAALLPILERRHLHLQTAWHQAAYLLGEIDDEGFRRQPVQHLLESRLRFISAVRADLRGEREAARLAYRSCTELPPWQWGIHEIENAFRAWRLRELGEPAP